MVKDTYRTLYIKTRNALKAQNISGFELEARLITAHALGISEDVFIRDRHLPADAGASEALEGLIKERLDGKPLAYILGSWSFYGLSFKVTPEVLIPRIDTEVLIDTALDILSNAPGHKRILDLCSGSGCIGCTIACKTDNTLVVMGDISNDALNVSRENTKLLGVEDRCSFVRCNALNPPGGLGMFDMILCNPPYIPTAELDTLDTSVKDYEPGSALDGGIDGLIFYRSVSEFWSKILNPGGHLLFEAGINQSESIKDMMHRAGFYDIFSADDTLSIPRVVCGRK